MSKAKEFDRSVCFTYFGNYDRQIKNIEKQFGLEQAYKVQTAIIEYGLYGFLPEDPMTRIMLGETTIDLIDSSQQRRENGFGGDKAKTQKVIDYFKEHPNATQDEIAKATNVSKGKVNKVLKALREEKKEVPSVNDIVPDSDNDIDTDNGNDTDSMTVTVTATAHTKKDAVPASKTTTATTASLSYEDKVRVMEMFAEYVAPKDIMAVTGFTARQVNSAIDEYRNNGDKIPKDPKRKVEFPTTDGIPYSIDLDECTIDDSPEGLQDLYEVLTDPVEECCCEPHFTAKWIKDTFGFDVEKNYEPHVKEDPFAWAYRSNAK